MRPRCKIGQHRDVLLRGGRRIRCETCGDDFPCLHACEHLDCDREREQPGSIIGDELGLAAEVA